MALTNAKKNIKKLVGNIVNMNDIKEQIQKIADAILTAVDSDKVSAATGKELAPAITSGETAPSTTPAAIGAIYINTTAKKAYVAVGTSASTDWKQISNAS